MVWMRLLALSFGSMVFAVGAVLSSVMAGLALGSFVLGRVSDRWKRPLLAYAMLEAGIGVTALIVPRLLSLVGGVALPHGSGTAAFLGQASFTFALSFIVLLVPTALMGGTLPLLSRVLVGGGRNVAARVGGLYSANTFGGVAGVALGGIVLLPLIGMARTTLLAVALNLAVAICVGAIAWRGESSVAAVRETSYSSESRRPGPVGAVILLAIGLSGLAAMVYEVSWTRSLALVIGSSIYAFSTMLLSFIFGIGLGSFIFAKAFRRRSPSVGVFSYLEMAIALSAAGVVFSFDRLPLLFMRMYGALAPGVGLLFIGELLICFLVMLVPTVLFGAALPLAAHIFSARVQGVGRAVGTVYGSNTLGCIVGSTCASFLLIPLVGLETTLNVAITVNAAVALLVYIWSAHRRGVKLAFSAVCIACVAAVVAAPRQWDRGVMSIGVAPNAVWLHKLTRLGDLETIASVPELLYYRDGLSATVAVKKDQRDISMSIDGKTDASAVGDLPTEMLVGYLPLFIHSRPETVMVLGLGSGISLAAAVSFGVDHAECLEIEPAVVEASRFFAHANRNVLSHPRSRVLLADARHHLLTTDTKYDVITSEPSNPWMAGISNLFTKEFYEICARRLNPGGVLCQFIHGYNLSEEDFRMVMATFSSVFPHKQLWSSAFGLDYLMIGSLDSVSPDLQRTFLNMDDRDVQRDLAQIGIVEATDLYAHFLFAGSVWDELATGARLNTDDLPVLEFSAPKSLYLTADIINSPIGDILHSPGIDDLPGLVLSGEDRAKIHVRRGDLFLLHDFFSQAIREYDAAAGYAPELHTPVLRRAAVRLTMAQRGSRASLSLAREDLDRAHGLDPNWPDTYEKMALLALLEGRPDQAAHHLKRAMALQPRQQYYEDLIDILVDDLKRYADADQYAEEALAIFGEKATFLEKKGFIAEVSGEYTRAAQYYQKAVEADPYTPANYRLGRLLLQFGQPAPAIGPLQKAVRLGPTFAEPHIALAKAYSATGKRKDAIRSFRAALKIDPDNAEALAGLNSLK